MYIELHLIQNFAPSCLNRDDTNSPKDCVFGGVRRARISSQCIKRAIRWHQIIRESFQGLAARSRYPKTELQKWLSEQGQDPDLAGALGTFLTMLVKSSDDKKKGEDASYDYQNSGTTMWLSPRELSAALEFVIQNVEAIQKAKNKGAKKTLVTQFCGMYKKFQHSPDVSMFGRMLANADHMNVDAACQVAHAISTHKVDMDMDFYTAVDELAPEDSSGADMMGTIEFNSACFYRYCVIHWEKLVDNLGGDVELARKTVQTFLQAAIEAIPTGKQNTFAAHNMPSLGFGIVREAGAPWSLTNAFETPARANGKGLVGSSIEKLNGYYGKLRDVYGDTPKAAAHFCIEDDCACDNLGEKRTAKAFVEALVAALPEAGS